MNDVIQPNDHLLEISRVVERMNERAHFVRLERNERVTPFSEVVFKQMLSGLTPAHFCSYPDPSPLYEKLSRSLNLPEGYLYFTNGSDAAIRMTFQTFVRVGDTIVLPDPTYAMYSIYSKIFQGRAETVAYSEDIRLDTNHVIELVKRRRPRILAMANPDQPTGAVLPETTLRELAVAAHDAGTLFILDEAYFPFYPHTAVDLVRTFKNVVVTRSFSKAFGLAGLRLGCLIADPSIVKSIKQVRGAHEVNAMAIAMGSYVVDHPELVEQCVQEINSGREVLAGVARELGLGFPRCPTNFQLLTFSNVNDTASIVSALKQKGYLVRGGFTAPAVRRCIRITLAEPEVMRHFAKVLREVVSELQVRCV